VGASVFSLTQFIEGFVGEFLRLPVVFLKTHYFLLRRGPRGGYELERFCHGKDCKKHFGQRAIAALNIVLVFSIARRLWAGGEVLLSLD
jgi:hypothetical protein